MKLPNPPRRPLSGSGSVFFLVQCQGLGVMIEDLSVLEHLYLLLSPSKSTVPSPLLSASLTNASISLLLVFSPNNFIMAYLISSEVIHPSPSISNYGKKEGKGLVCNIKLNENTCQANLPKCVLQLL